MAFLPLGLSYGIATVLSVAAIVLSLIALVIALVSAVAAVLLWRSARRANEIAAGMHAIEVDRRHDEQLPAFEIKIVKQAGRQDHVTLEVKLITPALLDEVVIHVLDEANIDHWARGLPPGITPEEADHFVWGPWEFNSLAAGQVADNRTSRPQRFSRASGKDSTIFDLARTRPGHWMHMDQQTWEDQRKGPVRLRLDCRIEGKDPWQRFFEVPSPGGGRVVALN